MNASRYFSHFLLIPFKHKCAASVVDFAAFFANFAFFADSCSLQHEQFFPEQGH